MDGLQETSTTLLPGMVAPNKFLGFGVTADDGATSNRFLNGALDDVRIYDSVLTTNQAQAIYETELMGNQSSVIANDGQAIRFALNVNDAASTILSGLPNGTVVSDGTHTVTVGAAGTADISGWNASEISLSNYGTGSFMFNVTGTDAGGAFDQRVPVGCHECRHVHRDFGSQHAYRQRVRQRAFRWCGQRHTEWSWAATTC